MFSCAICDDDILQCEYYKLLIENILKDNNIEFSDILITSDQNKIFNEIYSKKINILFLDIDFKNKGENGINFAKKLRNINKNFYLIFLTGDMRYMPLSFENKPFDYLIKPISKELIEKLILRLNKEINQIDNYNFLKLGKKITISNNSIIFIEKQFNKCLIHTVNGNYFTYSTLTELIKLLPANFVRCHRCYIANLDYISIYDKQNSKLIFKTNDYCFTNSKFKLEEKI